MCGHEQSNPILRWRTIRDGRRMIEGYCRTCGQRTPYRTFWAQTPENVAKADLGEKVPGAQEDLFGESAA